MFSKFFINRPRFAMVIACVLSLAGIISAFNLPVRQYPNVAPPQIRVIASFPGADAATLANTVAAPLEEAINGVDDMIYMSSTSSSSGTYVLAISFKTGTDPNMSLVKVQNRVQQATPLLPTEVTERGITTNTSFSDTLGFLALTSPNGTWDKMALADYAFSNIRNALIRVPGIGDVQVFGARYSIRIWLDPEHLAGLGLSASDVASAVESQNRQASVGSVGSSPGNDKSPLVYSMTSRGRLASVREFEDVIVRTSAQGGLVRLKDVARIELGAESYNMEASLNLAPAAMMALSQASDANALDVMRTIRRTIDEMSKSLPDDMRFEIGYDSTEYVRETIAEIINTLLLTFSLVVLVCYLFLQDWRVTLIPVAAIPISLLATFTGFSIMGFSINILTLFGLVLVIGTVVDDAIIVVERVLFVMERDGSNSTDATIQAMKDVTGPMTATTLVFLAIFVPVAFMSGITGEIYRQFAVTISFSVVFSLIVALTLSPAMCAHMLQDVRPKTRGPLAWFNKAVNASRRGYVAGAMWIARKSIVTIGLFALIVIASYTIISGIPTTFVPDEDQGAVISLIQLPEGASLGRTKSVLSNYASQLLKAPGVKFIMAVEGFSFTGDSGENVGMVVMALDNWSERKAPGMHSQGIAARARAIAATIPDATINVVTPPAIQGMGVSGGLELRLQATMDNDPARLQRVMMEFMGGMFQSPEIQFAFSSYTADTPHLYLEIDREKAEVLGIPLSGIFGTLQTYFGTAYINDINIGTQVNKVILQSDWPFRSGPESLDNIHVMTAAGAQAPLKSFVTIKKVLEPRSIARYNMYPAAAVTAYKKPGFSTGQGIARVDELSERLPSGYKYEWTGMTYQEMEASGQVVMIIIVALAFGYLFLVAQYESWTVPLGVILSMPVALLGAMVGIKVMGLSISIYVQLGILLLVGLVAKNGILIIEFAQEQHEVYGLSILDAAAEAGRERFRSVMMTAFTCVLGVMPMLFASGAGAQSRIHVGTTMFFGMGVATVFGIFLIPGVYAVLQKNRERTKAILKRIFFGNGEARS
ncbi:MAG: efflux RND transporter permease subunit [Synergistaceae bacterium]|jgi:hydrophobe/amphiphile efflux-1 (HAE1) family protein|nr:efflux RND transporter permease subunit [Synergistaceae bacterium]